MPFGVKLLNISKGLSFLRVSKAQFSLNAAATWSSTWIVDYIAEEISLDELPGALKFAVPDIRFVRLEVQTSNTETNIYMLEYHVLCLFLVTTSIYRLQLLLNFLILFIKHTILIDYKLFVHIGQAKFYPERKVLRYE